MDLMKRTIHMDRVKCSAVAQVTIEDDINITDSRPDVYQLVTEQGCVTVEEVRAVEDHVHIRGTLRFQVLYISDEEVHRPACMEGSLPIEEQVYLNGVSSSDNVTVRAALEDLSVGMINSRKLSVQALANLNLSVETVEEIEAAVGIDGEETVPVGPGETVRFERSEIPVKLINLTGKSFTDVLNEKLIWRSRK